MFLLDYVCPMLLIEIMNFSKWKPGVCATNSQTVYQLVRAESLSVYMDHDTESCINIQGNWDMPNLFAWKSAMHRSLQTFGMKNKEFQFCMFEILFVHYIIVIILCLKKEKYYFSIFITSFFNDLFFFVEKY